jgi:hypothetical protein
MKIRKSDAISGKPVIRRDIGILVSVLAPIFYPEHSPE